MENIHGQNNLPSFDIKENGQRLTSLRHAEYMRYRAQYREYFGVLPELDKVNHPTVAIPTQSVFWPGSAVKNAGKSILKATGKVIGGVAQIGMSLMSPGEGFFTNGFSSMCEGIGKGSMQNPELMAEFCRRFDALLEPYKEIYTLLFEPDLIPAFGSLPEGMHVANNLGYYMDSHNQIYMEGTWNNGVLVYGMFYSPKKGVFIGNVTGNMWKCVARKEQMIEVGCFDSSGLECAEGFSLDLERQYAFLGPYHKNYMHGVSVVMDISSGDILKQEYQMGEPVKGIHGFIGRQKAKLDTHKNTISNFAEKFIN